MIDNLFSAHVATKCQHHRWKCINHSQAECTRCGATAIRIDDLWFIQTDNQRKA